MTEQSEIKFYSTLPHPCSYLDDLQAVTIFMDPEHQLDRTQATMLSEHGFRRSGSHIYRPNCLTCQACIPVRVPVQAFTPKRSFRRAIKRNEDLEIAWVDTIDNDESFKLYARYIEIRHSDGDMYPATREQYQGFLVDGLSITKYVTFRLRGELIAVAVMDWLNDGFSAVYTFFEPEMSDRSLGRLAILWQIECCRQNKLPYLYLGYWIKNCDKMSYKTQFRPLELYVDNRWIRLE